MRRQENNPDGVKAMEFHDDAAACDARGRAHSGEPQRGPAGRPAPPISSEPGDFAELADYLTDAVVRYDLHKRRVYCNSAHRRYAELAGERLEGQSVRQASIFSPEDTVAYDRGLDRVLATGEPMQFEIRMPRVLDAEGQAIELSINIHPEYDDSGAVCGILTTGRDITAMKRAIEAAETKAREFETLVELTPDFVIRYDVELRRTYCNPAAAKVLPRKSTNLGKRTDQGSCLLDPSDYARSLRRCMDEKRMQECEMRWVNDRGELRDGHILMTRIGQGDHFGGEGSRPRDHRRRRRTGRTRAHSQENGLPRGAGLPLFQAAEPQRLRRPDVRAAAPARPRLNPRHALNALSNC
jgi:PAS domain S-box-containing protein